MTKSSFLLLLQRICTRLTHEARQTGFTKALEFEARVRAVVQDEADTMDQETAAGDTATNGERLNLQVDTQPPAQAFPDIVLGDCGIEVKFTESDSWRCIANSVLETNKVQGVHTIAVVYCKMGGTPEVKFDMWDRAVMHVRTSHVPRFELEIGAEESLFSKMNISYANFSSLPMSEKMQYIRKYAKARLREGEHLWWIDDRDSDDSGANSNLQMNARLYIHLPDAEQDKVRAEALILCPQILGSGRARNKYSDAVMFMMTYYGILCHQARDLYSSGSAAGVGGNGQSKATGVDNQLKSKGLEKNHILKYMLLHEAQLLKAITELDKRLFKEYWGENLADGILSTRSGRIQYWLKRADEEAKGYRPSDWIFKSVPLGSS